MAHHHTGERGSKSKFQLVARAYELRDDPGWARATLLDGAGQFASAVLSDPGEKVILRTPLRAQGPGRKWAAYYR